MNDIADMEREINLAYCYFDDARENHARCVRELLKLTPDYSIARVNHALRMIEEAKSNLRKCSWKLEAFGAVIQFDDDGLPIAAQRPTQPKVGWFSRLSAFVFDRNA